MIDALKDLLQRRPFAPFRVILSSGHRYDVRHPEFAWLVKGGIYVGLPTEVAPGGADLPDRAVFCLALHLVGVEQLVSS